MSRRPLAVLAAALLLTFTGAACGGGDDDAGPETSGSEASDAKDEPSTETSSSDTTAPDVGETTVPGAEGPAPGTEAYCTFIEEVQPPPDEDKAGNLAYLQDWKAVAPDDLKDDMDVIIAYSETVDFADDPGEPPADVAAAASAVTQYGMDTCG
jgi:hypothetical protein